MRNERDVFEWRRLGHWNLSAAKARFSAFVLWSFSGDARISEMAAQCEHHSGDAGLAISEAFHRECALALELVVKAVIADRLRARNAPERVPATHDVPKLWKEAGLPALSKDDLYRLHLAKSCLMWSGRYATPRTAEAWERESQEFAALEGSTNARFSIRKPVCIGWTDFDRIYQIAAERLQA